MKRHYPLFAFIGLVFSPLSVAHATDSVHSHAPFDYEQHQLDHPSPAAKRLATLETGQPRTVRLIYFLAKDRPFRAQVVREIRDEIRKAQTFFAEQMQAHGHGNKTFRFETNAEGEPLVHRVDGQHPASYYIDETIGEQNFEYVAEIGRKFDFRANIYVIYRDIFDNDSGAFGGEEGKSGGLVLMVASGTRESWDWEGLAHELGHAFGLGHDFRDDKYIMSYGVRQYPGESLSACTAEFLAVHPYFNSTIPIQAGTPPTIQLTSPTEYPASAQSVSIQIKVRDLDGIHQIILSAAADSGPAETAIIGLSVKACRGLAGKKEAVVEFDYDGAFWRIDDYQHEGSLTSLADSPTHSIFVHVIDTNGNASSKSFELTGIGSYDKEEPFKRDYEIAPGHIVTVEGYTEAVNQMVFSPDGTMIASAGRDGIEGGSIRLWDAKTLQNLATMRIGDTGLDRPGVSAVAFSPDGTMIASGRASGVGGGSVRLWDAKTRQLITTLIGHKLRITGLAFSPDGTMIASSAAEDNAIRLWDVKTRKTIATLKGHTEELRGVAFSPPDGTMIASGERDGTIRLWDVKTRKTIATFGRSRNRIDVAFPPDGSLIAFSPDGSLIAFSTIGNRDIWLWDVKTQQLIATLKGHTHDIGAVAFSPDGTMIASGGLNRTIQLWNAKTQQLITTLERHPDAIRTLAFSPDGTMIVSGSKNGTIWLWDVPNGAVSITGPEDSEKTAPEGTTPSDDEEEEAVEPQAWLTPDPSEVAFSADDPAWKTFTVHTNLDSVLVRANPSGSDPAIEVAGGQDTPTRDYCPAEGNDSPSRGRQDGWSLHVKACQAGRTKILLIDYDTREVLQQYEVNVETGQQPTTAVEPQAWLTPNPAEAEFSADDPAWKTFTVHTNLDSVLVRANPSGSDPAIEVAGGQDAPTRAYCPAEGNDSPSRGRRDGWSLHVKACQAGQTKILLIDYDTDAVVQQYEIRVEASTSAAATTALNPSYPNPFNSETVLSYTLPTAADIRLEVFTLNGQRVAVLYEGLQVAGYHTIAMDASALASGVYLYRLTTPEGRFVQKFTLLR